MAIYKMCSVLDMVAQQYGRPFFAVSEGSATRGFSDEINGSHESVLSQHPADFQLFLLGEFDDATGVITLLPTPQLMVNGSALVKPPAPIGEANWGGNRVASDPLIADLSAEMSACVQAQRGANRRSS